MNEPRGPIGLAPGVKQGLVQAFPGRQPSEFGVHFVRTGSGNKGYYRDRTTRYARVSDISGAVVDKGDALAGWAAKQCGIYLDQNLADLMAKWKTPGQPTQVELNDLIRRMKAEHRYVKEAAADIGKDVHKWIQNYAAGLQQALPEDPGAAEAAKAFIGWGSGKATPFRPYHLRPLATEQMLCLPGMQIAGTADFVGEHVAAPGLDLEAIKAEDGIWYVDEETKERVPYLAVRDWKTANGCYPDQLLQCAIYALCVEFQTSRLVGSIGAVVCTKDGQLLLEHADMDFTDRDRAAARAAVRVARYAKPELWQAFDKRGWSRDA